MSEAVMTATADVTVAETVVKPEAEKARVNKPKRKKKFATKENQNKAGYTFMFPFAFLFVLFIIIPIGMAIILSFTNFDTLQFPEWIGFDNYITLITSDTIFMKKVLMNTIIFAVAVGPGGYVLSFLVAWALSQMTRGVRTVFALIVYSPTMTGGVAMTVLWKIMFSGDQTGYINSWLINLGVITEPIIWLASEQYLLIIVIIIGLWSSMGVGFLAILAGMLNADESLYEAAAIDGVKNRFQEMIYITVPSMKPQMLFAAVMAIVNAFQNGAISTQLAGNPTPGYSAQLIVNHIEDYGFIRYEMGYAAAVSVVLLLLVMVFSRVANALFAEKE